MAAKSKKPPSPNSSLLRLLSYPFKGLKTIKRSKLYAIPYFRLKDYLYQRQVEKSQITPEHEQEIKKEIDGFNYLPKISIVMPVYNIKEEWLTKAIDSVINQLYDNWELCIADDASQKTHIKKVLSRYCKNDPRIRIKLLRKNRGISGCSNAALDLATGEFVALLDHDDELSRESLFEVVRLLNSHGNADIIYSDEDKLTMAGERIRPVYKPDWDPELLLTHNYFCHLVVCRLDLIREVGGFRLGFEGSQDYDLILRMTELTDKIFHIPKVLYHWRMIPGSAAALVDAKPQSFQRSKQALLDAMERRGHQAEVLDGKDYGTFLVKLIKTGKDNI